MKNIFLKTFCIALLGITVVSCSKDDETPSFQKENFLSEYLATSQLKLKHRLEQKLLMSKLLTLNLPLK